MLVSLVALTGNIVLFAVKLMIGILSGSISVIADALNDLLDGASSMVAVFGFYASNKRKNAKHRHGHGRVEYISSMVVSIVILVVALTLGYVSVLRIINPTPIAGEWWMIALVLISIISSGSLALFYWFANRKLESSLLKASSKKDFTDMISTSVTLLALLLAPVTNLPVDGFAGVIVSGLILVLGLRSFMESAHLLIGNQPEKDLSRKIRQTVLGFDSFARIVRMDYHDYGPTMREAIIMVELTSHASRGNLDRDIHDVKTILYGEYAVKATIYWAP